MWFITSQTFWDHHTLTRIVQLGAVQTINAIVSKKTTRSTLNACLPTVFGYTNYTALRPRATESASLCECTISHQLCHHTHYCRTSNDLHHHHRLVSSRLERSAPSTFAFTQRMLYQKIVRSNDGSTLSQNQRTILPRMRASQMPSTATIIPENTINTGPLAPHSLSRRQCRKLQRTILPRTTKRHKCRHPSTTTFYSLRSSPVKYAPPPLEGGAGNLYTSPTY